MSLQINVIEGHEFGMSIGRLNLILFTILYNNKWIKVFLFGLFELYSHRT